MSVTTLKHTPVAVAGIRFGVRSMSLFNGSTLYQVLYIHLPIAQALVAVQMYAFFLLPVHRSMFFFFF